jgi:hypothetical protein
MECKKAKLSVRHELVEGQNGGFIALMLRSFDQLTTQHKRGEFRFDTYHWFMVRAFDWLLAHHERNTPDLKSSA